MARHAEPPKVIEDKRQKPRQRRGNACNTCKKGKTKCDGGDPCSACRMATKTCGYSHKLDHLVVSPIPPMAHDLLPSQSYSHPYLPAAFKLHNTLSLNGVVEEFVNVDQAQGRVGQQIDRLRCLWSNLGKDVTNKLTHQGLESSRTASPCPCTIDSKHIEKIRQTINQGRFIEAWNAVAASMRQLESNRVQEGPSHRDTWHGQDSMRSICLQLIDWECALSFHIGGSSQIPSWSQARFLSTLLKQQRQEDTLFAKKLDLYHKVQEFSSIDVSHEEGLCKLLQQISDVKRASPAPILEELAINTAKEDSVAEHELKFVANLVFLMLFCRTATIYAYYASERHCLPKTKLSDILTRREFSKSRSKTQLIKHASVVLDTFEILCALDPEATARNPFGLYGVLIAAIVVTVAELRTRKRLTDSVTKQVRKIKDCFEIMKSRNVGNPVFEGGIIILEECLGEVHTQPCAGAKTTTRQPRKRTRDSSLHDNAHIASQRVPKTEVDPQYSFVAELSDNRDDVGGESRGSVKRRNVTQSSLLTHDTLGSECQGESFDISRSNSASFNNGYGLTPSAQPNRQLHFVNADVDVSKSFVSDTDTIVAQSPMADERSPTYMISYDFLRYEMPRPPQHLWPEYPPLEICQPPLTMWPGRYSSSGNSQHMTLASGNLDSFGDRVPQGLYPNGMGEMSYENQTTRSMSGSFGQYGTSSMEFSIQTVASFDSNPTLGFLTTLPSSMSQAPGMDTEACFVSTEL